MTLSSRPWQPRRRLLSALLVIMCAMALCRCLLQSLEGLLLLDQSTMSLGTDADAAEGGAHGGSEHADNGISDDADGSQDGSYTWSATSLILEANCLAHAREHFLALYRQQLSALEELTSREQGGRIGGMRRRLANKRWETVQAEARRLFQGEFLEQWRDYEFRSTHEYRPRNRPSERRD